MSRAQLGSLRLLLCLCLTASFGCVSRLAVNTTAGVLVDAQDSTRAYFDYESAGIAAPSGIMQFEGLHSVSPDNEGLTLLLAKAYMAYAYGWVMDAHDVAELQGDFDLAEHHQQRAYLMYSRAHELVLRTLVNREPHFATAMQKNPAEIREYLKKHFPDAKDDVPPLFWLMMTWSSAINNSPNSDDFVDMPAIKTIAEWIVQLDPGYEDGGALVFLGGFNSSYPKQLGGDPAKGKEYFERVLQLTQHKNHIVLVNYAVFYAISVQDRALFTSLLHEVVSAGDQGQNYRLANKVARRRAQRLLARVDELFIQ